MIILIKIIEYNDFELNIEFVEQFFDFFVDIFIDVIHANEFDDNVLNFHFKNEIA